MDSARANLAATFVNAFVNAGFGQDKLVTAVSEDEKVGAGQGWGWSVTRHVAALLLTVGMEGGLRHDCPSKVSTDGPTFGQRIVTFRTPCSVVQVHWIFKNKDHGKMSATASLGTVLLWDVEGGLPQVGAQRAGALFCAGLCWPVLYSVVLPGDAVCGRSASLPCRRVRRHTCHLVLLCGLHHSQVNDSSLMCCSLSLITLLLYSTDILMAALLPAHTQFPPNASPACPLLYCSADRPIPVLHRQPGGCGRAAGGRHRQLRGAGRG